jgi:sirohydrochlorin ferrochelatase
MRVMLVDNGSLRPEAWINLCRVARAVSARLGFTVHPASVLHSTRMDPDLIPAEWPRPTTWERATKAAWEEGEREFVVLPFFFGPTGAITEYLPERCARLREKRGDFSLRFAPFLADAVAGETMSLPTILADQVRAVRERAGSSRPPVVLVDHGSPRPEVTAVRDRLGPALAAELGESVDGVRVASMERREGTEFAFNEPLLERALRDPALPAREVIVAMLFLSPGRHAGPDGDVAGICAAAEAERPGLRVHSTALVGEHPGVVDLLAARWAALAAGG